MAGGLPRRIIKVPCSLNITPYGHIFHFSSVTVIFVFECVIFSGDLHHSVEEEECLGSDCV